MAEYFSNRRAAGLVVLALIGLTCGCTHMQLQKNTVRQARTLGDIHQQQVLNNLAMFVYDYNSFPSFSIPNQGGSNVTDTGTAAAAPGWSRGAGAFLFDSLGLSFGAAREAQESFTMTPVNDPRKLELMRCAYQQAASNCGYGEPSKHCPDCQAIMNKFYTGDPDGDASKTDGTVNVECLKPACWFQAGCKKCVPKHCPCTYVGEYCGCYVWVLPEGRNELAKLTLAILDYAVNDSPTLRSKQVVYYIDEYGLPTTQERAVGTVTAAVGIDEAPGSLLNSAAPDTARLEQVLTGRLQTVNFELARLDALIVQDQKANNQNDPVNAKIRRDERGRLLAERQALENKLQYINEQFRTNVLKNKFYPPAPSMAPGSLLLPFNLQQDILTPGRARTFF
jgi:hypothetical protein